MQKSDFRNNPKCFFNDNGFCKFGEKCRKQHYRNVCSILKCDKSCKSRHPKSCKYEERCKFFAKNICAYKHVTLASEDEEIYNLKIQIESLNLENKKKLSKVHQLEEN